MSEHTIALQARIAELEAQLEEARIKVGELGAQVVYHTGAVERLQDNLRESLDANRVLKAERDAANRRAEELLREIRRAHRETLAGLKERPLGSDRLLALIEVTLRMAIDAALSSQPEKPT